MPDVAADPIGALVALLLADSDVAAVVAARGFGGELPAAQAKDMPRPAFVLRASGGVSLTGGSNAEVDAQRVDLFAYGATPNIAGQLADLIALKLRRVERQTVNGTLIHWVKSAGGYPRPPQRLEAAAPRLTATSIGPQPRYALPSPQRRRPAVPPSRWAALRPRALAR